MSGQRAPSDPESETTGAPSFAAPPKQRFKEASSQQDSQPIRPKRPFVDPATEILTSEASPSSLDPTDRAAQAVPFHAAGDGVEAQKLTGKQQKLIPSLIRNVAPFRKPRVGSEFQATIPALQPRPPPKTI